MLLRPSGNIKYEKNWEKWNELSKRQLVRPAHPCRINVIVFACNPPETQGGSESSQRPMQATVPEMPARPTEPNPPASVVPVPAMPDSVPADNAPRDDPEQTSQNNPTITQPEDPAVSSSHGVRFTSLPRWEQSMLLKMHRNLGHPAPERLSQALQSAGYRAEVVQAAHDIKCPTCMTCSPPKAPRPAHLKPMMDFNHKIYLDGVT